MANKMLNRRGGWARNHKLKVAGRHPVSFGVGPQREYAMSSTVFDNIPKKNRDAFLAEFLEVYVDRQGLGTMPKADLDALILHLYCKYAVDGRYDSFSLSELFKIRETRIKSLVETGSLRFANVTEGQAWANILTGISTAKFELESLEKGQIRFKLENPSLHRFLQKRVREHGGTVTYSPSSEVVTISLSTFFEVLDDIYLACESQFKTTHLDVIKNATEKTIEQIAKTVGKARIKKLKDETLTSTKLGTALDVGSKLSGIGSLIAALLSAA